MKLRRTEIEVRTLSDRETEAAVVYGAYINADLTEGRGPMVLQALFFKEEDARYVVKGMGVMGVGDGTIEPVFIHDGLDSYVIDKPESRFARQVEQRERKELARLLVKYKDDA